MMTHEELILSALHCILGLEERKSDEEARKNTHDELCHDECRIPPMSYMDPMINS